MAIINKYGHELVSTVIIDAINNSEKEKLR
jgi:hypothetical protein